MEFLIGFLIGIELLYLWLIRKLVENVVFFVGLYLFYNESDGDVCFILLIICGIRVFLLMIKWCSVLNIFVFFVVSWLNKGDVSYIVVMFCLCRNVVNCFVLSSVFFLIG